MTATTGIPSHPGAAGELLHRRHRRSSSTSCRACRPFAGGRDGRAAGDSAQVRRRRRTQDLATAGRLLMFSGFMTNAWEVGTIVAIVAGVVGFFVVLRGAAFPAHAIPNGAFAGAAGANLIGVNPLVGLGVFSVLAALGIGSLGRRGKADVATALALVMMLALGAAFLSQSTQYEPEIFSLLFGEILGVSTTEILPVAVLGPGLRPRRGALPPAHDHVARPRGCRGAGDPSIPRRAGVPARRGVRHDDDGAGRRRPAGLHPDDRAAGGGPLFDRPARSGDARLGAIALPRCGRRSRARSS